MNLLTVEQLPQYYPIFTQGMLRWLLFNRKESGLSKAVVKIGRRIFIDKNEFDLWLLNQKEMEN